MVLRYQDVASLGGDSVRRVLLDIIRMIIISLLLEGARQAAESGVLQSISVQE